MIVDANVLLYAVDSTSPHHDRAAAWLTDALHGHERIGLPWQTLGAFLRIATHPRVSANPLTASQAQAYVDSWLAAPVTWIPPAGEEAMAAYRNLTAAHPITGNLVPDAQLAAIALWLGVVVVSADTDFARFPRVQWINPLV